MANEYSNEWFETFLVSVPDDQTKNEVEFLTRQLPLESYRTVLDLCCGMGRHARELSARGYAVTGVDSSEFALERAGECDQRTKYIVGDMRNLRALGEAYDAVLILWQSFGNFDAATNEKIVREIAERLTPNGRFVLDIYHRAFFEANLGVRRHERGERVVVETKTMVGDRLRVELDYGAARDVYEWQLFTPDEIAALAARYGLKEILRCAKFDEATLPLSDLPRMQMSFELS